MLMPSKLSKYRHLQASRGGWHSQKGVKGLVGLQLDLVRRR